MGKITAQAGPCQPLNDSTHRLRGEDAKTCGGVLLILERKLAARTYAVPDGEKMDLLTEWLNDNEGRQEFCQRGPSIATYFKLGAEIFANYLPGDAVAELEEAAA